MMFGKPAICRGIIEKGLNLREEIEQLSDPRIDIEVGRIVNLVGKYLVNFEKGGGLEDEKISERQVNKSYHRVHNEAIEKSPDKIQKGFAGTAYQRRMLSCPSTISIVKDIIDLPLQDVMGDRSFHALDLGSGSGILQVAYYIQALRSGLQPNIETSVGIELNPVAQHISCQILQILGIGKIIQGSTLDSQSYDQVKNDFLHVVGNENITDAMNYVGLEPFIENLEILQIKFGDSLSQTQFTPSEIVFMASESTRAASFCDVEDRLPAIIFDGNVKQFLKTVEKRRNGAKKSGTSLKEGELFYPSDLKVTPNSKERLLEELGDEWIGRYFSESFYGNFPFNSKTRWIMSPQGYMNGI